jgi:hypothetical protein
MKKIIAFSVSLLSILSVSMLQSCSSTEDNNMIENSQNVTINHINLEKKWLTTFYDFTPTIKQATKTAYQVSSVEVNLKNGAYTIYDRYSLKEDKGTYTLDKDILTMKSSESGEVMMLKVGKLTQTEAELKVVNHADLVAIELISIK